MKARKYLTLDTETATLPFADQIARNSKEKQDIAIARPLVYDIGWVIHDSKKRIYAKRSFLVTEIFSVPAVFNTAYYKEKRPLYLARLRSGDITLKTWAEITELLFQDLQGIDFCTAANAQFDYKKAIPFTEQYIYHLYSDDYQAWEDKQRMVCLDIINKVKYNPQNRNYDAANFTFKGIDFPIIDTWGVACSHLINTEKFKKQCFINGNLSDTGKFFETSVESVYQFLHNDYDFSEEHTAISDALVEMDILTKALQRGRVVTGIVSFPFKLLGTTDEFLCSDARGLKKEYYDITIGIMRQKILSYDPTKRNGFKTQLDNAIQRLEIEKLKRFGS